MALDFTTYAGLQAAIGNMLNRPDLVSSGDVAGFIKLAEGTLARELRRQVSKSTLTIASGGDSAALAGTVAEIRSITPAKTTSRPRGGKPLTHLTWENFNEIRSRIHSNGGGPKFYTVLNGVVYVTPQPTDSNLDFDITTFDKYVPVSTSTTLLLEAPDLLFYGALVHSAPFLEHDERLPMWVEIAKTALDGLNEKRQKEEFGMSLQAARLPVNFG